VTAALPPLTPGDLRGVLDSAPRACREEPEFFTSADGETTAERARRVGTARVICADCPIRLACLGYALRTRATSGVWGGMDADAGELDYVATAARGTGARPPRSTAAIAIAGLRDRHPEMSAAEIAARVGVHADTVRRHLATQRKQADAGRAAA
jgi:WhiB family transcriptional regulator, redox-sensing transcriptional regulator